MEIPVLIEPTAGNGYQARCGEPIPLSADGATREEALQKLRRILDARLAGDVQVAAIKLPPAQHPWAEFVGMWKDDPYFDEWQQTIAELRRKADEDPRSP